MDCTQDDLKGAAVSRLIGEGPHDQVHQILDTLTAIRDGDPLPRVVVLEGESGCGKTRIVREVYARLRAEQDKTASGLGYWPPLPDDVAFKDGAPDVGTMRTRRKRIGSPDDFYGQPGALPSLVWWSMGCAEMDDGSTVDIGRQPPASAGGASALPRPATPHIGAGPRLPRRNSVRKRPLRPSARPGRCGTT